MADNLVQTATLCPGGLNRLIIFPRRQIHSFHLGVLPSLFKELRQTQYDAVIDFQGLLRSALMTSVAKAPLKCGFSHAREGAKWFYNHRISLPPELQNAHAADKNLHLMRRVMALLNLQVPAGDAAPDLPPALPASWREDAQQILADNSLDGEGPLIAVGASSRWESKSWPIPFFAATLNAYIRLVPNARIWFLGTPGEEASRADAIIALCDKAAAARMRNLAGKTSITGMTNLLASSQALLTNDSGPMHIAAALRVPCVALFGSTSPQLTGPYGPPGRHAVICSQCPESPCFKRHCPHPGRLCSANVSAEATAVTLAEKTGVKGLSAGK